MARNVYISHGTKSEQSLYDDILIEAISIYGHDVYYIPRKIAQIDGILNEDVLSRFNAAFKLEMYIESYEGMEGDGKLFSKFGFEIRDQLTFVVSNRRWNSLVGRFGYTENGVRPREGDLIYLPLSKGLFEVRYVEDKKPFYQLAHVPTFKLTCELFEYSNQEIDTGVQSIDNIQRYNQQASNYKITYADVNEKFKLGETLLIELPSGITGNVEFLDYEKDGNATEDVARLGTTTFDDGAYHTITSNTILTGMLSGAVATVDGIIESTNDRGSSFGNDDGMQNYDFKTIGANGFIDFSIDNPFGEPIHDTP
tara:strand:- start:1098 stop:2030 length:933 start_codon:yes stop_codon:yes gene_type:complete